MKYFFDTEFEERPSTIDLISIGIVSDDDREFYAEVEGFDWSNADPWLVENVKPHLRGPLMPRDQIRDGILTFVGADRSPEFCSWYGAFDWVAFCWLFGRMIELPVGWQRWTRDLKQMATDLGNPQLPKLAATAEHDALADARWLRDAYRVLTEIAASRS